MAVKRLADDTGVRTTRVLWQLASAYQTLGVLFFAASAAALGAGFAPEQSNPESPAHCGKGRLDILR